MAIFLALSACGGSGSEQSNDAPVVLDPGLITVEGGVVEVIDLATEDAINDLVTFTINSGDDKGLFILDSDTGELEFINPPDYQKPKDSNQDNQYELTIVASNRKGSSSVDLLVEVTESYSISGAVSVDSNTYVDSDVNDIRSTRVQNSQMSESQLLPNLPAQLVGYINVADEGANGQLNEDGDLFDIFQIEALGGERITLDIANENASEDVADLDLYLYDSSYELIATAANRSGEDEGLVIPNISDTYYIRVIPIDDLSGAFDKKYTYKLVINSANTSINTQIASSGWTTDTNFVIGDIVVKEKDHCDSNASDFISSKQARPKYHKTSKSGLGPSLYSFGDNIVDFSSDSTTKNSAWVGVSKKQNGHTEVELKAATLLAVKEIARQPCVEYAEPNYIMDNMLTPNDIEFDRQWHYEKINLPEAWDTTTGGDQIKIAVLDTVVVMSHPDLSENLSDDGYDFVRDSSVSGDGDGIDADPDDPGTGFENPNCDGPEASSFHGTHVAGTVGAHTDNNLGVAGVGWNVELMPVRVMGCQGRGSTYNIAQGVRYATGLDNSSGTSPSDTADIINMSLGGKMRSATLQSAIADAIGAGVIIVASAGNNNDLSIYYPAGYEGVISVAATTTNNNKAWFSNYGSNTDVAAPGVNIWSTSAKYEDGVINYAYENMSGTSMAVPQVSGIVGLMKSVYGDMTPENFEDILISGNITDDLGEGGRDDYFGFGLINAKKAVEYAKQIADGSIVVPQTPLFKLSYSNVDFGSSHTEVTLQVSNTGSENSILIISSVQALDPFVTVTAPDNDDGLGSYTIRLDRTGLSPGVYQSSIRFVSNAGEKILPLTFKVLDPSQELSIYLTNIETGDTTKIYVSEPVEGKYHFNFSNVVPGNYTLKASNDLDNDGVLCEGAEGCGQYGDDSVIIISLNADIDNINFDLRY